MKTKITVGKRRLFIFLAVFVFAILAVFCFGKTQAHAAFFGVDDAGDAYYEQFTAPADSEPAVCAGIDYLSPQSWINCLLLAILQFLSFCLQIAATIFNWIIDPINMNMVMDNQAIYSTWAMVRDALNISFIMVLLFSAFCTIFQVERFSYKRVLLSLVIMALLVNFSYPIARFIIDLSNVLMYYFINALHVGDAPSGSILVNISKDSQLYPILHPGITSKTSFLIAAVVFIFIYSVTLLIISVLFVIRTVALAILIIFSSLAFTGSIVPSLSQYASKWWDNLFRYAFFGPIMIFMMYIAVKMLGYINTAGMGSMAKIAQKQSNDPGFIAAASFFAIPIIILWMGLGIAQSMSIAGAGAVVGRGTRFMKWAGGAALMAPPRGAWYGLKKTGAPGAVQQRYNQWRGNVADKQAQREAKIGAKIGVQGAEEKDMQRRKEEFKKNHTTVMELLDKANKGDVAAALLLAENGDIDNKAYEAAMKHKNKNVRDLVEKKTREKRADVIVDYKINEKRKMGPTTLAQEIVIARDEFGKLSPDKWKDQDINKMFDKAPTNTTLKAKQLAAKQVYLTSTPKNQDKMTDNMQGSKYATGKKNGVWA